METRIYMDFVRSFLFPFFFLLERALIAHFVLEKHEEQLSTSLWLGEGMYKKNPSQGKRKKLEEKGLKVHL